MPPGRHGCAGRACGRCRGRQAACGGSACRPAPSGTGADLPTGDGARLREHRWALAESQAGLKAEPAAAGGARWTASGAGRSAGVCCTATCGRACDDQAAAAQRGGVPCDCPWARDGGWLAAWGWEKGQPRLAGPAPVADHDRRSRAWPGAGWFRRTDGPGGVRGAAAAVTGFDRVRQLALAGAQQSWQRCGRPWEPMGGLGLAGPLAWLGACRSGQQAWPGL